jgi:hypothetical protein
LSFCCFFWVSITVDDTYYDHFWLDHQQPQTFFVCLAFFQYLHDIFQSLLIQINL